MRPQMGSGEPPSPSERRFRRSRLLLALWSGDEQLLMHADTLQQFRLPRHLSDLLARLTDWSTADELAASGRPIAAAVLDQLWRAGILEAGGGRRDSSEGW